MPKMKEKGPVVKLKSTFSNVQPKNTVRVTIAGIPFSRGPLG